MTHLLSHLAFFQAQWEGRFLDTVSVDRVTDRGTFNATTGAYDAPSSSNIFTGSALIRPRTVRTAEFGEEQVSQEALVIFLPLTATGIDLEDQVTVTSSQDPELTGEVLTVTALDADTYKTHIEITCERPQGSGTL